MQILQKTCVNKEVEVEVFVFSSGRFHYDIHFNADPSNWRVSGSKTFGIKWLISNFDFSYIRKTLQCSRTV